MRTPIQLPPPPTPLEQSIAYQLRTLWNHEYTEEERQELNQFGCTIFTRDDDERGA